MKSDKQICKQIFRLYLKDKIRYKNGNYSKGFVFLMGLIHRRLEKHKPRQEMHWKKGLAP